MREAGAARSVTPGPELAELLGELGGGGAGGLERVEHAVDQRHVERLAFGRHVEVPPGCRGGVGACRDSIERVDEVLHLFEVELGGPLELAAPVRDASPFVEQAAERDDDLGTDVLVDGFVVVEPVALENGPRVVDPRGRARRCHRTDVHLHCFESNRMGATTI